MNPCSSFGGGTLPELLNSQQGRLPAGYGAKSLTALSMKAGGVCTIIYRMSRGEVNIMLFTVKTCCFRCNLWKLRGDIILSL